MATVFDDLDPAWKPTALLIEADLITQKVPHIAFCGRRLYSEQRKAFASGASKCDGLNPPSLHQCGLATDWVALDEKGRPTWDYVKYVDIYKAIRDTIIKHGGEAGGSWMQGASKALLAVGLGWDPPHGQIKA